MNRRLLKFRVWWSERGWPKAKALTKIAASTLGFNVNPPQAQSFVGTAAYVAAPFVGKLIFWGVVAGAIFTAVKLHDKRIRDDAIAETTTHYEELLKQAKAANDKEVAAAVAEYERTKQQQIATSEENARLTAQASEELSKAANAQAKSWPAEFIKKANRIR